MSTSTISSDYEGDLAGAYLFSYSSKTSKSLSLNKKVTDVFFNEITPLLSGTVVNGTFLFNDSRWALTGFSSNYASVSMGIGSGLNLALGPLGMKQSGHQIAKAYEFGDVRAGIEGALSLTSSTLLSVGGAGFILARPLTIASMAKGVTISMNSTSLLGRVTCGVNQSINGLFGVFYTILGINALHSLCQSIFFKYRYMKGSDKDKVKILKEKLSVTPEEKKKIEKCTKEELEKEAIRTLPKVSGEANLTKKEWKSLFSQMDKRELCAIGYALKIRKIELKREAYVKRMVGKEALSLLNKVDLDTAKSREVSAIIKKAKSVWNKNAIMNALSIFFAFTGVALTIAGFIVTGGIGAVVIAALWVFAVVLPMTIVDGYAYYLNLKDQEGPGKHDKKFLLISSLLAIAAMITSIGLTCAFSFAILPIILTLVIGACWLGLNAFSYRSIVKAEKASKQKKKVKTNKLVRSLKAWKKKELKKKKQAILNLTNRV